MLKNYLIKKIKLIFLTFLVVFSFFADVQAKKFSELEKIINNPHILSKSYLIQLKEKEYIDFLYTMDFKHIIHAFFINYELGHRYKSKINTAYEIKNLSKIRMLSKNIDNDLYFYISLNYSSYFEDLKQRTTILLELKSDCEQKKTRSKFTKIYSALALNYYNQNELEKAIYFWKKAINFYSKFQKLEKSSTLNNISLAFNRKGNLKKAIYYNVLSYKELNSKQYKTLDELSFLNSLIANKADYFVQQGRYKSAHILYQNVLNFCLKNESYRIYASEIAVEIMRLDEKNNTKSYIDISQIEAIYFENKKNKTLNDLELENIHLSLFISYYNKTQNYLKSSFYYNLYLKNITLENSIKIEKLKLINEQIVKDNIKKTNKKNELKNIIKQTKTKQLLTIILFLIILSIVITFYKIKAIQRKSKLLSQQNEIEIIRKKSIVNELKLQKEINLNLQLNLDIKKKSEMVFMDKLKEIRRKKTNDPEEIIKELQLQIINLLQIDKKNNGKIQQEIPKDENAFKNKLISLDKNLSEQELRLCVYFKMYLSTKEISQLEQHLAPASIRVLKNRIKNKLELSPSENLNQYLNSLNTEI